MKQYEIGDKINGEYEVLNVFGGEGQSGMGVVYLVESKSYFEPFVIKTFQGTTEDQITRFKTEAEAWVEVGIHENIVQALFADLINDRLFIGAEYIAKDEYNRNTISDYLEIGGYSDDMILKWAFQFCWAMQRVLEREIQSHRDIKPDNLMVDANGNLKVVDFGLSKYNEEFGKLKPKRINVFERLKNAFSGNKSNPSLTQKGTFMGTILYASPEQLMDSSSVDFRSDIYSFGIVLYQLITRGKYPYSTIGITTVEELAIMHLREPIIEVNHFLFPIIKKCLSRSPLERYSSYQELTRVLKKLCAKLNKGIPVENKNDSSQLKETFIKAYSALALSKYDIAEKNIELYLNNEENDSTALLLAGRIKYELNKIPEAEQFLIKSLSLDPFNPKTYNNLGLIYGKQEELKKGISYLNKSIQLDSLNSGAHSNLAILQLKNNECESAYESILKALEIAPDKKTLVFNANNLSVKFIEKGEIRLAQNLLEQVSKIDSKNFDTWFNLGLVLQERNILIKAVKAFQKANEINSADDAVIIRLIKLFAQMSIEMERPENMKFAIHYCDNLIDNGKEILKANLWKAQYLSYMGQFSKGINLLKNLSGQNPDNDTIHITMAQLYLNEGKAIQASEHLERCKDLMVKNNNYTPDNQALISELEQQITTANNGYNQ